MAYLPDGSLLECALNPAPLQGVSESVRKRRERGKRRDADTVSPQGKLDTFTLTLPYLNHPSLISGFIS